MTRPRFNYSACLERGRQVSAATDNTFDRAPVINPFLYLNGQELLCIVYNKTILV